MRIADLHGDVISKMLQHPGLSFLQPDERLDITVPRLRAGGVTLQVFALYLPEALPKSPESLFHGAELYYANVLSHPEIHPVRQPTDLEDARRARKIGALLSLEGADGLQGQWWALRLLHRLGVRLLGPTWNHANWACDGASEPRGGGLTARGRKLIKECESLGILVDVSHLSDRGFWDVADIAARPFFASHSNARALTPHARNLTDDQIRAIIAVDGIVGLTFVPWFVSKQSPVRLPDVLRHVDHVCGLGGERHLAFGSDFDGIDRHIEGLAHPGDYPNLRNELLKRYPAAAVEGFMGENARRFFRKNLRT